MRKLYSRFYTLTISVLPSRFRASIWQTSSLLMHCITLPFLLQSSSEYPTQVKHFIAGNRSARTVFVISKRKKTTDNIIFIVFSYIFSRSNELQSHRKRGFCTCYAKRSWITIERSQRALVRAYHMNTGRTEEKYFLLRKNFSAAERYLTCATLLDRHFGRIPSPD